MDKRVIDLHDEAILLRPDGASHNPDLCQVCLNWSVTPDGLPSGWETVQASLEDDKKPYGDVLYADPGLLTDGRSRFPVDTEAHARASMAAFERSDLDYGPAAEQVEMALREALDGFSVEAEHGEEVREHVQTNPEGLMDTINKETHEALLTKAVDDATRSAQEETASLREQVVTLTSERDSAAEKASTAEAEVARLSEELDKAQLSLKSVEDEKAELEAEITRRDDEAKIAEVAQERASQVRNLGLFNEEYIEEKASRWASLGDDDFTEMVESWKAARQGKSATEDGPDVMDSASALTGTSEATEIASKSTPARKTVLGLA